MTSKKPYVKPSATPLTNEEGKARLLEYASAGDEGAKRLLELIVRKPVEIEQAVQREKSA